MRIKSVESRTATDERIIENDGNIGTACIVVFLDQDAWNSPDVLRWSSGCAEGGGGITIGADTTTGRLRGVISTLRQTRMTPPLHEIAPEVRTGVPVFDIAAWPVGKSTILSDHRPACCWMEDGRYAIEIANRLPGRVTECVVSPLLSFILGPDDHIEGVIYGDLSVMDRIVLDQAQHGYLNDHIPGTLPDGRL